MTTDTLCVLLPELYVCARSTGLPLSDSPHESLVAVKWVEGLLAVHLLIFYSSLSRKKNVPDFLQNKSYTPWREGPDFRQIQYKNYICPLH